MKNEQTDPYIQYFSHLFPTPTHSHSQSTTTKSNSGSLKTLQVFSSGLLLSQIFSKIKQFPHIQLQQNPTTFAHSFSNLKEIYKKIQEFWNQQLNKQMFVQEEIDLVEIAHHKNTREIQKLLNLAIQTMVLSSQCEYFISKILETSPETQHYFMSIVQNTLEKRKTFSPRKQKEQRLYDKIIELNHENENLQHIIMELCKEKQEFQSQSRKLNDKISQKQLQIKRLCQLLSENSRNRHKNLSFLQSQGSFTISQLEKTTQQLEKTKKKLVKLSEQNQKQVYDLRAQIDFLKQRSQYCSQLQSQIEIYKVKIQSNTEAISQYGQLSKKFAQSKLTITEKDGLINQYIQQIQEKSRKIQQLEESLVENQLQLQRKNVLIEQLSHSKPFQEQIFPNPSISSLSLQRSLSEHCPQFANTQTQFLYQCNKKLREELQRATSTIKEREQELEKLKKSYEKREGLEVENKKLVEIIQQIQDAKETENALILGCMYQLRNKVLGQWGFNGRQKAKKLQIKNGLKMSTNLTNRVDNVIQRTKNLRKLQV